MIKKIFSWVSVLLFCFFIGVSPTLAQEDWVIDSFRSDIHISSDARVNVVETIDVDFGDLQKHGIFRDIPVSYVTDSGNRLNVILEILGITDQSGSPMKFTESREGKNLRLKIGHPNIFVTGKQIYVISYDLTRVITNPNNEPELYWNATGLDWPVPMLSSKAVVTGEGGMFTKQICFAGVYGSTNQDCAVEFGDKKTVFSSKTLNPGEGMTFAIKIDPNKITLPTWQQKLWWFIKDNWLFSTPVFTFLLMLRVYWRRGRDKKYKNIFSESGSTTVSLLEKVDGIMTFGPPEDLSPGEVGVLADEVVHSRDITAVIIDLASRGFFNIKEDIPKSRFGRSVIELILNKKSEKELLSFEKSVLDMLFSRKRTTPIKLNKLHSRAHSYMQDAQRELYEHMTQLGYFSGNPQKVRGIYLAIGVAIIILGMMISTSSLGNIFGSGGGMFASITSGIIVVLFSFFMPARTPKGRKALKEVVGLREWIRIGAWREKIHEKNNFIEEVLPYTIAFGLTKKFIKALKDADLKNIDWYQSNQAINTARFMQTMNSFDSSVSKAVSASKPSSASSGGSGFSGGGSGGGFGGGGGGSW